MEALQKQTVGQIVTEDYRTAQVFRDFGLDFCCGGNKTIEEACAKKDVDPLEVEKALQNITSEQNGQHNFNEWSLDFLIDYIIENHHKFSRSKLPEIGAYTKKVANVHGDRHEELKEIYHEFTMLHADMINHLNKEEEILFPYIKQLVENEKNNETPDSPEFGKAANPIAMMEQEHNEAGAAMEKIQRLSNNFTPPEDACATYRILFKNLEGFQKDLHKHVHLENNILFPKALKLEQQLNKS